MIDDLVKSMLSSIPKRNSEELSEYIINKSMLERLSKSNRQFSNNEISIIKMVDKGSEKSIHQMMKTVKLSNKLISSSDTMLSNLFNNLDSKRS